jgi:hypothetical protein
VKGSHEINGLNHLMGHKDHSKEAMEMVKGGEEKYVRAKKLLEHAQKWYEKHANQTRRHVEKLQGKFR